MTSITGNARTFDGDTTSVHDEARNPLLARSFDAQGNEYIYLQGVASTVAGDFVTFDEAGVTTRTVADAVGRVAVAMAATVASTYGWYQIYGKNVTANGANITADAAIYLSATAGRADGTLVVGDTIIGAIARTTDTGNAFTVELNYPQALNVAV